MFLKNKTILIFTILLVLLNQACTSSKGVVQVLCNYQMNACGDCTAQYKVKSVLSVKNDNHIYLKGKTIKIIYFKDNKEVDISFGIKECLICYDFIAEGELIKSGNEYTLYATKFTRKLRKECCDK
ncbi:hypothetical protein DMB65_02110 [Flavobacterium cheongpyeongense]|uniref:Uncharacterized protein n=1 Tax=Flavobacterium cheongpyeongense TaxID=2212651 RepID=A0A2V4BY94_9FLAO|nr:hypothetical protein [Flavobacterium cheongpyeongense]PXY42833.1 hypothetical protein DMB65_02110 [Flavobacterium cheongpyeongense]